MKGDNNQKVLLIKELLKQGFSEKLIVMIVQVKQPYVNKIKNGRLHFMTCLDEGETLEITPEQQRRLSAAQKILSVSSLPTVGITQQDFMYMHLLRFLLVPKEKIYALYDNLSHSRIDRYLLKKDVDILAFDSTLLNIPKADYLDLILDYIE